MDITKTFCNQISVALVVYLTIHICRPQLHYKIIQKFRYMHRRIECMLLRPQNWTSTGFWYCRYLHFHVNNSWVVNKQLFKCWYSWYRNRQSQVWHLRIFYVGRLLLLPYSVVVSLRRILSLIEATKLRPPLIWMLLITRESIQLMTILLKQRRFVHIPIDVFLSWIFVNDFIIHMCHLFAAFYIRRTVYGD